MNIMRGGGKHSNKKNKAEKKQPRVQGTKNQCEINKKHDEEKIIHNSEPQQGQQEPKKDKRMLSRENVEMK